MIKLDTTKEEIGAMSIEEVKEFIEIETEKYKKKVEEVIKAINSVTMEE
jgi:phosphoenolpyruvate carboxylase